MAIGKIEPTGCTVHKGKVRLRLSFYLEPGDARYDEHHAQVPDVPFEGYLGKVDSLGRPIDQTHYDTWMRGLPQRWINNPFHNHFIYVDADTPDAEIKQLMAEALEEFYGIWAKGEEIAEVWKERPLKSRQRFNKSRKDFDEKASESKVKTCENKIRDIQGRTEEFQVVRGEFQVVSNG